MPLGGSIRPFCQYSLRICHRRGPPDLPDESVLMSIDDFGESRFRIYWRALATPTEVFRFAGAPSPAENQDEVWGSTLFCPMRRNACSTTLILSISNYGGGAHSGTIILFIQPDVIV